MTRGLILAAGRGSRMGRLTDAKPKGMVRLGGQPLLAWQHAALKGGGVAAVDVVGGYRADMVAPFGERLFVNDHWAATQMVMSLCCASPLLRRTATVVSYSDIFYSAETIRALLNSPHALTITYDSDWQALWRARFEDPRSDGETFRIDDQGRLLEIGGTIDDLADVRGQFMGLLKFTPEGWDRVERFLATLPGQTRARLDMTALLSLLIAHGTAVHTTPVQGLWGECDTPRDLALYESWVAEGRLQPPASA